MRGPWSVVAGALLVLLLAASCGDGAAINAAAEEATTTASLDRGTWRVLPGAPIGTSSYAVSGWSGSEALFWAGSNLARDFANTSGAAYDPASDSWRELPVPGWGHPGLTGVVFDGQFYVAAKGGGSRMDPSDGSATDLPPIGGFWLSTLVATDEAVWGVGPLGFGEGADRVGIARYEPAADAWIPGPIFDGTPELGRLFQDRLFVEQPVLWTGSDIVVWTHDGHGIAFDPTTESWRTLPALVAPEGTLADSEVAVAESGLVAFVEVERSGDIGYAVASWDGETWTWHDTDIELADFHTITIAAAGDWIVVFSPDQPPAAVHVATGRSLRNDATLLAGVQAPNVVWTGDELVVWGGAPTRTEDNPNPPAGAAWAPPAG